MKGWMWLIGLCFVVQPVCAEPSFGLQDFAWRADIEPVDARLQRIDLDEKILRGLTSADAADVAVFDAHGQKLPSLLRRKPAVQIDKQVALEFHRFDRRESYKISGSVVIDKQQLDAITNQVERISIQQPLEQARTRQAYIIELDEGQTRLGIERIELDWTHQPASDLLALKIEAANDLDSWVTIAASKNLFKDKQRNSEWITLQGLPSSYRYYRLTPVRKDVEFTLLRATGLYQQTQQPAEVRLSQPQTLAAVADQAGYYTFKPPLAVQASSVQFDIPAGYFLSAALFAGNDEFASKRVIQSRLRQHNLADMNASSIDISAYRYDNWWLHTDTPLPESVRLVFSYPAYELFFINNQHGPFTLAFGNFEKKRHSDQLSKLLEQLPEIDYDNAVAVATGEVSPAAGEQRMAPAEQLPWLTWLLWLLLGLAVLITARMALTLYRDMNP